MKLNRLEYIHELIPQQRKVVLSLYLILYVSVVQM